MARLDAPASRAVPSPATSAHALSGAPRPVAISTSAPSAMPALSAMSDGTTTRRRVPSNISSFAASIGTGRRAARRAARFASVAAASTARPGSSTTP